MLRKTLAPLALLVLPLAALAGGHATLTTANHQGQGGSTIQMEWKGLHTLRMQSSNSPAYMVMRDGKMYSVSQRNGKPMVMDMGDMMKMMGGMGGKTGQKMQDFDFMKPGTVEDTGRTETVAGIKGKVYHMTWTDKDGKHREADMVLTDDATVVEMTNAYMNTLTAMFGSDKATGAFRDKLPQGQRGVLRVGKQYQIQSINDNTPADSEFKLPAQPMDLQKMMMQGMQGR